jgi:hypothetical protein
MVHKKCSDVKGSLEKVKTMFVCRRCLGSMKDDLIEKSVIIGKGVELEKRLENSAIWGICWMPMVVWIQR